MMNRAALAVLAIAFACTLSVTPAAAASSRTAVSGLGNDENPCTLAQPCRTLQGAFNVTAPGGEILVLDPAGYGSLNITHAISIEGHGWASLNTGLGGTVITVNAGPNDVIILRGLVLEGFGTGSVGVDFGAGLTLIISDTIVRNFSLFGVRLTNTSSSPVTMTANHVVIHNIPKGTGLSVVGEIAATSATLSNSEISGTNIGVASVNTGTVVTVRDSLIAFNSAGVEPIFSGVIRLLRTTVTGNATFVTSGGNIQFGQLQSLGQNSVFGNTQGDNTVFDLTISQK